MTQMIGWTLEDHVAIVTLDRPERRNALGVPGWRALAGVCDEIVACEARVVILRSSDAGIFSAGADIAEFDDYRTDRTAATGFREAMRVGIEAVANLPMPVIAAIDGGCYGAAVALVLAADIRVAGDGAQFATTPAKLGISYPREDVARLIAQIGRGQASRMLFTGEILEAADALAIGLVELRGEEALPLARIVADRVGANAPSAIRLLKATLADPAATGHDAAFDAAFAGPEFLEGQAAFRERRRPRFA